MSHDKFNPQQHITNNKLGHSGQPPYNEKPYNEKPYPLTEETAETMNVPDTPYFAPVTPADGFPVQPEYAPNKQKRRFGPGAKLGAIAAGLFIAAGGAFGVTKVIEHNNDNEVVDATAPGDPVEVGDQTVEREMEKWENSLSTGEELSKEFRIPTGLSDEELANTLVDRLTDWSMYGTTPELAEAYFAPSSYGKDFFKEAYDTRAAETAEAATAALFTKNKDDWGPSNTEYIDYFEYLNDRALFRYCYTSSESSENTEPYKLWVDIDDVRETTNPYIESGDRTLEIDWHYASNSDKNHVGEINDDPFDEGPSSIQVDFVTEDGYMVIQSIAPNVNS